MVEVAIGALIGSFTTSTGAYLLGATMWASVAAGAMLGYSIHSMLQMRDIDSSASTPTYSFGPLQNSKSQKLPIPLVYGGAMRVAGNVFYERFEDEEQRVVYRYIGISAGSIQNVSGVKAGSEMIEEAEGCQLEVFLSSDASTHCTFDPVNGPRPYPNGLAFIACKLKASEKINGSSVVTMIVNGRRVWTPKHNDWFTTNPAWIIRDLLTDPVDGCGVDPARIDEDSFANAARYYEEQIQTPDGTMEPRFSLTYVVDTQRKLVDHLADMLACCRSMIVTRDKISLYVDAPAVLVPFREINEEHIIEGSFSWWQSADEERLNRVSVEWVDPNNEFEQTVSIFEDVEDIAVRGVIEKTFSLLGITSAAQAGRMGAYLLDNAKYVKNFCTFQVSLKDADIEIMDVIGITNSMTGWVNKLFRVVAVTDVDSETDAVQLTCSEYIPEIYNDRAMDVMPHIDTELQNPFNFDLRGFRARQDHTAKNKVILEWKPVVSFAFDHYEIREGQVWETGTILSDNTKETSYSLTVAKDGNYHYMLKAVSVDGLSSKISYCSIAVVQLNPPKVTGITATGSYRAISVHWDMPEGVEVGYFEIYSATSPDFSKSTLAGKILSTDYDFMGLGVLETRFVWVKAVSAYDPEIKSPVSDYATATTEPLPEVKIPDASITESKLIPGLADRIHENNNPNSISLMLNAVEDEKAAASNAIIQQVAEIVRGEGGLTAQWYVKTDVNGKIAGFGLLNDSKLSEFAILVDSFKVARADGSAVPVFELDTQTGKINLIGDFIADGSITGEMINARSRINLADGGQIVAGEGAIFQLGGGDRDYINIDSELGIIRISNSDSSEFIVMDKGDITTYKRFTGSPTPVRLKSLRVLETGEARNGTRVQLQSFFPVQPQITVSIRDMVIYDPRYSGSRQRIRCLAQGLTYDKSTGRAFFTPSAVLSLVGSTEDVSVGAQNYRGASIGSQTRWIAFDKTYILWDNDIQLLFGVEEIRVEATLYAQIGTNSINKDATWHTTNKLYLYMTCGGAEYLVGETPSYTLIADRQDQNLANNGETFENSASYGCGIVPTITGSVFLPAATTAQKIGFRVRVTSPGDSNGNAKNGKWASEASSHVWVRIKKLTQTTTTDEVAVDGYVTYTAISE